MKRRMISFFLVLVLCLNLCPIGALAAEGSGSWQRRTIRQDITESDFWNVPELMQLDLNTHTYTREATNIENDAAAIRVAGTGSLTIFGGGQIISVSGAGVEVQAGGSLNISDAVTITGGTYALDIAAGANVQLSAGTYIGGYGYPAIRVAGGNYATILGSGCVFYANGNVIKPEDVENFSSLTVAPCTDHANKTYKPDLGTPTHTWTCANCGTSGTENCTFIFDATGVGTCTCGNRITVNVVRDSLKEFAYDNAVRPKDGTVTVKVDGATEALTEGTDYTVSYGTQADVGSSDITVTVTVTGAAYNGTFTGSYPFTESELTRPVFVWASNVKSVPYTGSPVTTGQLPGVTINIETESGVDLRDLLQYSYREQGGNTYTNGLPTNAGTYDVVVSIPAGEDYQAASSDPITLIIEKIDPVDDAPAAALPTYNRTEQALVTAGTLDPVAKNDNLVIKFSTSEDGPWTTNIPTGTNAGNYDVWYMVEVPAGKDGNYNIPDAQQVEDVAIQRKSITPVVELEYDTILYDGGIKKPKVTVKDGSDDGFVLPNTEYTVDYANNQNVSTEEAPAKVIVSDSNPDGGNYTLAKVTETFKITHKEQGNALSINGQPNTVTYGDVFTLHTSGGQGDGNVTWEIVAVDPYENVATVNANSGQVTITGDGTATVKAKKAGGDNYIDATATWTFTANKKRVTATVTAEDKTYDGDTNATVKAVVESGVLSGDVITITGLTGTFADAKAGVDKTVTVVTAGASITGKNSEHYEVSYSATSVKATINKKTAEISSGPVAANLTYTGTAQALIQTEAVINTATVVSGDTVEVEYALDKDGTWSTNYLDPTGTNAGTYTVWYRVKETGNYTGQAAASVNVTIAKKQVSPAITLDQDSFEYDGTEKKPGVTVKYNEDSTDKVIPADEYTVAYDNNINVSPTDHPATVTVTAKDDGNYTFASGPVTESFTISSMVAQVVKAPVAINTLIYNTEAQELVTAGEASGGTMKYSKTGVEGSYSDDIPEETSAGTYTVYYKVEGDGNHSDYVCSEPITVKIAPKTVKDPTIELRENENDSNLCYVYTYNGNPITPNVVVKDGLTEIASTEYNTNFRNNTNAGTATVDITSNAGGNYLVSGSTSFTINKADITFPVPTSANITYDGKAHELLNAPSTTAIGGAIQYALNSPNSTFNDAIPTGIEAGTYNVYYKVNGDGNHNDLPVQGPVSVTIERKELTTPTIELTPKSFKYDGKPHQPTVVVKDGETVLPASEYTWVCTDSAGAVVTEPKTGGTYTITISDAPNGNYDLSKVTANTATFTIGKAAQAELVIKNKPEHVYYGDKIKLEISEGSGSGTGDVTWTAVGGNATIGADDTVTITGMGDVTINVVKKADDNYEQTSAQWEFTVEPKSVEATVTVSDKPYDGTIAATVTSATIPTINSDTVTIVPNSITATFDTPNVGEGKTVTLLTGNVKVDGDDAAKYKISFPETVMAAISKANTTIDTEPEAITGLAYTGQPQELVKAGKTNVGYLVYSLDNISFSREIPTGTDAKTYTVYYKVEGNANYTGVDGTTIPVTIGPKNIVPEIELSGNSFPYDGAKHEPKITVKDGGTVLSKDRDYTIEWTGPENQEAADLLTAVGTYTATIKNVNNGNYAFTVTAEVNITPAEQSAIHITGNPADVYYGDTITTLGTTGGTGQGTVKWTVTAGAAYANFDAGTNVLHITGIGAVTVQAERTVPNFGSVKDSWNFTVKPKPVTAEVSIEEKFYDGGTTATVASATIKGADLVTGDSGSIDKTGIIATFDNANAGTGKTVKLDASAATKTDGNGKYAISYPATTTGTIKPKGVSVTVTLSGNDLKTETKEDNSKVDYYEYDGTEKNPTVTVTAGGATLTANDYSVSIIDNKNVGDATVTVTAKAGGNYSFSDATVKFEIRSTGAELTTTPQAKQLVYARATPQELVTGGVATGGHIEYRLVSVPTSEPTPDPDDGFSKTIPTGTAAGTYKVEYKVVGDGNHKGTEPSQVNVTIQPKPITPSITLDPATFVYDGSAKTPTTVTVKDGTDTLDADQYAVTYRDNTEVGTATVTVSNTNGSNYSFTGTATFTITEAAPTVTPPTGKTDLKYTGEFHELLESRGTATGGTLMYALDKNGPYNTAIPTGKAVGEYEIWYKVEGDANYSDIAAAALTSKVEIKTNTVEDPTITLSQDQFTYNGNPQKPTVTVKDGESRLIAETEYEVTYAKDGVDVAQPTEKGTYTVNITATGSNYAFTNVTPRTFEIKAADQETISISNAPTQVTYGDKIQLRATEGTGDSTVKWEVKATDGSVPASQINKTTGLLTVMDVNKSVTVTVTRSKPNYGDVSAKWEFTAAKKPVTAVLTAGNQDYDPGNVSTTVNATVPGSELVTGDSITITGLTGTFADADVGTDKTVTVNKDGMNISGKNSDKYEVTIPATTTASILGVAATVDPAPTPNALTYDASKSQELVTAGDATGGTMVYSLDGKNFTLSIPTGKDAGDYKVYYKAQGDKNHTDSEQGTVDVTIGKQSVTLSDNQIELSPPNAQYNGQVHHPEVTLRDGTSNVIPSGEYKVTYEAGKNWTDKGTYTVQVDNIDGGNYDIVTATKNFEITSTAQAPFEIVNKPGEVHYGDTFTLSATGGSGSGKVTWSVENPDGTSNNDVVDIDGNGFVTIKGVGEATIKATKEGGTNYGDVTASYPLNAHKKQVTVTVTADDKVYDGVRNANIHFTWNGLVGSDEIDTTSLTGAFKDENVGTNKQVDITGTKPPSDLYEFTIPASTTASITKAAAKLPEALKGSTALEAYNRSAQQLMEGGDANTLYSDASNGVYKTTVPMETNAGTYTVWCKQQGDSNHTDSEPQAYEVTISPKTVTVDATDIELSGDGLQHNDTDGYFYMYDGNEKKPTVTLKEGSAVIPANEYTVTYSGNRTAGSATATITDNAGGNYEITVTGTVNFKIKASAARLTGAPQDRNLSYNRTAQQLVTVGTATGGHIEYKLVSAPTGETAPSGTFSKDIPTGTIAGDYKVDYKVVGENGYADGETGSITVTIQPKTVVSPEITVTGTYTYDGNAKEPTYDEVKVEDGTVEIPDTEYTLSYRDNVNVGKTATVVVVDKTGGNYTVNGTGTFEIGKAVAVGTAPTGKTGLKYTGESQELITAGSSSDGTMVYAQSEDGPYLPTIPTEKAVGEYTIWYKVQGDANHSDSTATQLLSKVKIDKNTVTTPTVNVTPESVTYNGEKQEPTVTVTDDEGRLINSSEYTVTYVDENSNNNLINVGKYTLKIAANGTNYDFTGVTTTAKFTITPADQTPLTITGTKERVSYGDTVPLSYNGGSGGTVTWEVVDTAVSAAEGEAAGGSTIASIDANTGVLKIEGVGAATVKATCKKPGYADQTATWPFYANKKAITAIVAAEERQYNGNNNATLEVTWKPGDLLDGDSITTTGLTGEFNDANVGTGKTVKISGTITSDKYDVTVPATTTGAITKAAITSVTAPEVETETAKLTYTGQPLTLVKTAGTADGGTMEYSTDGQNYSTALPTGTIAGDYDVWYRVKGDGNHNDKEGTKLTTDTSKVTIAAQVVADPTIEFTPNEVSYNGAVQKPSVTVKDVNSRVIPESEYEVEYSNTDWKSVSATGTKHEVTITDKANGNYNITTKTVEFKILPAGQDPLSIVNQPGVVRYGTSFTLSTMGGTGTGTVSWTSNKTDIASIDSNTGLVTVHKAGGPVIITATRTVEGREPATATWSFSVEKKPVTAIVTAEDKEFDGNAKAELVITWTPGDVLRGDTIDLASVLTGKFKGADVGDNKTVEISGTVPENDKYDISYNTTTKASITRADSNVTAPTPISNLTYSGQLQTLANVGSATGGTIKYSVDGIVYGDAIPQGKNAGQYQVWYKVIGDGNHKDLAPAVVPVTILPKEVADPTITLSPESFTYDGTPKRPDVTVKDGSTLIPASEYTASYSNNVDKGTATVNITDNEGGNYNVSGSKTFAINAGAATLISAPQPNNRTYDGSTQALVTAGTASNGKVVYAESQTGTYSETIPMGTNAGTYQVWYKVQGDDGATGTAAQMVSVTIQRKQINPEVLLVPEEDITYTGNPCEPEVIVLDKSGFLTKERDYTVRYVSNTNVGTARVIVAGMGNYSFSFMTTFKIEAAKAKFTEDPKAVQNLKYNGTAQQLVTSGTVEGGTPSYSLNGVSYSLQIPTATDRGSYTVYAKVKGDSTHEDSEVTEITVTIDVNTVETPIVTLSASSFTYTGREITPTVTVKDGEGHLIPSSQYTVAYSNNINVGTARIDISSIPNGNYSFTVTKEFQIDASQTPLTIGGKRDTVYYGDTFRLTTTGGVGDGVTWNSSNTGVATIGTDGTLTIKKSGSVTITATKGTSTDTWEFFASPKAVTATVTAADKVYNGDTTANLTVTLNGLLPGEKITGVTAVGHFVPDGNVGTNKTVVITELTGLDGIKDRYAVTHDTSTTASITPAPASATTPPTLAGTLTYNGEEQALLTNGGSADGGNLMYSLDGRDYSYNIPTGKDVKTTYTVWYKVVASDENHKDSAAVKLGDVSISANPNKPTVQCNPNSLPYDGTTKNPTVVVVDDSGHTIPDSEYTVSFDKPLIAVDKYDVTITAKTGGNYSFGTVKVADAFEIVASSQAPVSIIDKPGTVHYGDTFSLSATGGSGSGKIKWSVEGTAAGTINNSGTVTVTDIGSLTVKAYRESSDGYSVSNTDSVTFEVKPKPVTPLVTAKDKAYNGDTAVELSAALRSSDLVGEDTVTLIVEGAFASADAGIGKQVVLTKCEAADSDMAKKYTINWPDSVTATINKVNAQISNAPSARANLTYNTKEQALIDISAVKTNVGTVVYSTSQNGAYSEEVPEGTNAGKYTVWYKVADSTNYTGVAPVSIEVEIKKANPTISTAPTATNGSAGDPLSRFDLGSAVTDVTGTFTWANPSITAVAGESYDVIFTPNDTANYNTVTIKVMAASATSNSILPPADNSTGTDEPTPGNDTNQASAPLRTTVSNGTASSELSTAGGDQLVSEAVKTQSNSIVLKPEVTGSVRKAAVRIPAATASQINSETNAALTISAPMADVTIPNMALDTLGSAGGTVEVVTEQVGDAVTLTLSAGGEPVERVPGGVTLTVPAEDATPGTVAVLVGEDGSRQVIQKSVAKDGSMRVPLAGSATVEIVDNSKEFDDVQSTDWESEAVDFVSSRELFNGTSATSFSPDQEMSRGMLTKVLHNLEGQPDQNAAVTFNDVSNADWYADSVGWAAEKGIVNGTGDGQFSPNNSITREQFAVMLWRYAGSPTAGSEQALSFTDAAQASSYAEQALRWAVANGVMSGYDGKLDPCGTATRAQAAQMLKNFMEKV